MIYLYKTIKYKIGDFLQAQGIKIIQKRIVKGWGVADYFDDIFIPSIRKFCEVMLEEEYIQKYNLGYKNLYEETIKLIDEADWTFDPLSSGAGGSKKCELREYIIKNIDYYWS